MKREINRWYSWGGYEAYKWKSVDALKDLLGLNAKCIVNIQAVDQNGILREVWNRPVGQHIWLDPCLFQVVSIYEEPKAIWVNEYASPVRAYSAHSTRESAELEASGALKELVKRVAVKYVEQRADIL